MTADSDRVTAYLADVRKRWDVFGEGDATPHLAAALEAALRLADRQEQCASVLEQRLKEEPDPVVAVGLAATAQEARSAVKELREVITAELPRESLPGLRETGE